MPRQLSPLPDGAPPSVCPSRSRMLRGDPVLGVARWRRTCMAVDGGPATASFARGHLLARDGAPQGPGEPLAGGAGHPVADFTGNYLNYARDFSTLFKKEITRQHLNYNPLSG